MTFGKIIPFITLPKCLNMHYMILNLYTVLCEYFTGNTCIFEMNWSLGGIKNISHFPSLTNPLLKADPKYLFKCLSSGSPDSGRHHSF